jgi:hypothetical protein
MKTYLLEFTERERLLLLFSLGPASNNAARAMEIEALAQRLIDLDLPSAPTTSPPEPPRGVAPVAADGLPAPKQAQAPDVRELGPIVPLSITKTGEGKKERLVVEWKELKNAGRNTDLKRASCWVGQKAIWPRVLERVRQSTVFLVKEKNGYLSIVGVKV